jgi:hypothetical protein
MICQYVLLVQGWGSGTLANKSRSGPSTHAYAFIRSRKWPVSPRNETRLRAVVGRLQSTTAVSFVRSGSTPRWPILVPANIASDMKSFVLVAERDSFQSWTQPRMRVNLWAISSNMSAAVPPSFTKISSVSSAMRSCRCAAVTDVNAVGAPVSPNGILAYQK